MSESIVTTINSDGETTTTKVNFDDTVNTVFVTGCSVEEVTDEKDLSMDDINTLTKYIHTQGIKDSLSNELDKVESARDELLGSLTGLNNEKDFIQDKLDTFESVEALQEYLKSDKNVEDFFVNEANGETIELSVAIDDEKRSLQFKRELLIYLKTTDVAHDAIDKEYEALEKATAEMDENLREACIQLSDNVLAYTMYLKDKANESSDEILKKKILDSAKYIESGYTFEVLQDVIDEHPSVLKNTVKELLSGTGVSNIGNRYTDKLKRFGIKVSLIPLVSNGTSVRSIEENVLIKDDEYKVPDLFIYSTIRYFAMADWNDENVKRFHASIALSMKRLISNDLAEEVRQNLIARMVEYLAQFDKYI